MTGQRAGALLLLTIGGGAVSDASDHLVADDFSGGFGSKPLNYG